MILTSFQSAGEFLQAAEPALAAHEAANNLMYGLALRLRSFPERSHTPPYFAVVRRESSVLAAVLMTPPHQLIVMTTDDEASGEAFDLVARDLWQHRWPVPGVLGPSAASQTFARAWQRLCGETHVLAEQERLYQLRQVTLPPQPAGGMRPAGPADQDLLADWLLTFWAEALPHEPHDRADALETARFRITDHDYYVWDDGGVVALAGRSRPTPSGYCIGPVYTPPQFRGRGYATALTAGLTQLLLEGGKKFVVLFTDLANPTSNRIYQKIGYRPVCDFDRYLFEETA